jgi:hypothetical protein
MPASPPAPPLLTLDPLRRARESARASLTESAARAWRRSWRRVYAECMLCFCAGYVLYGVSFTETDGERARLLAAVSLAVSYVAPLFLLLRFYLRHADDF